MNGKNQYLSSSRSLQKNVSKNRKVSLQFSSKQIHLFTLDGQLGTICWAWYWSKARHVSFHIQISQSLQNTFQYSRLRSRSFHKKTSPPATVADIESIETTDHLMQPFKSLMHMGSTSCHTHRKKLTQPRGVPKSHINPRALFVIDKPRFCPKSATFV